MSSLSSNRVARNIKLLDKVSSRLGITECGKNWLVATLDPFHDTPIPNVGVPDGSPGNSVVQLIKQSINISAPVGTTGPWDCHIVDMPNAFSTGFMKYASYNGQPGNVPPQYGLLIADISNNAVANMGGVTIFSCPTGAQSGMPARVALGNNPSVYPAGYNQQNLTINPSYTIGKHRIISKGIEVYNDTATLYQSGSVICYRTPVPNTRDAAVTQTANVNASTLINYIPAQTLFIEGPPANPAAAILLPDSRQWNATDGAYVVAAIHEPDFGVRDIQPMNLFFSDNTTLGGSAAVSMSPYPVTVGQTAQVISAYQNSDVSEFDMAGIYFTGLSTQTTLTLDFNVRVERFPSNNVPDLVVVATATPERDPVALALYSHIVSRLPVGVPVDENGLGDWFADVLSTAEKYISPIAAMIPHPYAQALSKGLTFANNLAQSQRRPSESNARTDPMPPPSAPPMPRPARRPQLQRIVEVLPPNLPSKAPQPRVRKSVKKEVKKEINLLEMQKQMNALIAGRNK